MESNLYIYIYNKTSCKTSCNINKRFEVVLLLTRTLKPNFDICHRDIVQMSGYLADWWFQYVRASLNNNNNMHVFTDTCGRQALYFYIKKEIMILSLIVCIDQGDSRVLKHFMMNSKIIRRDTNRATKNSMALKPRKAIIDRS
jgi:hypothetical protein